MSYCKKENETIDHTLLRCDWTEPIWFASQLQLIPKSENTSRFDMWLQDKFQLLKSKASYNQYMEANSKQEKPSSNFTTGRIERCSYWRPPPGGVLKWNTDAAFDKSRGIGAIAAICRDHRGKVVAVTSKKIAATSPLMAEALALREAALIAGNCSWPNTLFESDNLQLIAACRGETSDLSIQTILEDIAILKRNLDSSGFLWTKRTG